jgi:hypothetical protein
MTDVDAEVEVLLNEDDLRSGSDPLWAFLRRGHLVLTGLPGGGKSTALLNVAARMSRLSDGPVPLLASLADVEQESNTLSFRDRLLKAALKDVSEPWRSYASEAINGLLVSGGIALLLDSLDETYERRAAVVMELDQFLATVSPDVNILLATRDVAYAQAESLGWPHLRLRGPEGIEKTISTVIRSGASVGSREVRPIGADLEVWIEERKSWVEDAIRRDPLLCETPLLPVLLSLLAIERDVAVLPSGRAAVLMAVVEDVVRRRETRRTNPLIIGALRDGEAARAALGAFREEGSALIAASGHIALGDLVPRVDETCRSDWSLAPGQATETAEALIRFWDESGIFVISGAAQTVAPRVLLFAEIGDAMTAVESNDDALRSWVGHSLDRRSLEPVVLASGLSPVAADEFAALAVESRDRLLLLAVTRAIHEGATLSVERVSSLYRELIDDASHGDYESWESWRALLGIEKTLFEPDKLVEAAAHFPETYRVLVAAMIDLRSHTDIELIEHPSRLLAALSVHRLPEIPRRQNQGSTPKLKDLIVENVLASTVEACAQVLLGEIPEATPLVVEGLDKYTVSVHRALRRLLEDRGFESELEAERAKDRDHIESMVAMLDRFDPNDFQRLLEHISRSGSTFINGPGWSRLDELSDFVETMNFNNVGSVLEPNVDLSGLMDLVTTLAGFDAESVAAQAGVVLRRMDETQSGNDPFFALFDSAKERELLHWDKVLDQDSAVDLCLRLLATASGTARVAAEALIGAPLLARVVPQLRDLLLRVVSSERHVLLVAALIRHAVDGPEPDCWVNDEDPRIRLAAARFCEPISGGRIRPEFRRLLQDVDGTVRELAVNRLEGIQTEDLESALREVVDHPEAGWTCLSCGTLNALQSPCAAEKCFRARPNPSSEATRILELGEEIPIE